MLRRIMTACPICSQLRAQRFVPAISRIFCRTLPFPRPGHPFAATRVQGQLTVAHQPARPTMSSGLGGSSRYIVLCTAGSNLCTGNMQSLSLNPDRNSEEKGPRMGATKNDSFSVWTSRRGVLAFLAGLALIKVAAPPAAEARPQVETLIIRDGWVLRRSDGERLGLA